MKGFKYVRISYLATLFPFESEQILQGDHSRSSQSPADAKTKVVF